MIQKFVKKVSMTNRSDKTLNVFAVI